MAKVNEVIECLKKSLDDIRCIGVITHLNEILQGIDNAGNTYGRIFDLDGNPINTVEEFIGKISADDAELDRVRVRKERFYNSLSGVRVRLNNIIVKIKGGKLGDNKLAFEHGIGEKNPIFTLSYFADNDTDIPIKANYMDLVDVKEVDEDDNED